MEESDNSSTQEKSDVIPSLPTEAGTLTSTWTRQTTCKSDSANTTLQQTSGANTLQTTSTNDTHQTTSASTFTNHTTWTPHSTATWTPHSTSTWTSHSTSLWASHSTSTWTPLSTSTWTPYSTSTFQSLIASPWMSQNSFFQQQDDIYSSSRSLIGQAVTVSTDIDKPALETYQLFCKTCEQLITTVENLHRQLFDLQQTSAVFNSRLGQVNKKTQILILIELNMKNVILI